MDIDDDSDNENVQDSNPHGDSQGYSFPDRRDNNYGVQNEDAYDNDSQNAEAGDDIQDQDMD